MILLNFKHFNNIINIKLIKEMQNKLTIFQRLNKVLGNENYHIDNINSYNIKGDDVLFQTHSREEFEIKSLELKQQNLLARQWKRAQYDISNKAINGLNNVKLMYRDAELMDDFPEIGTALDIVSEEVCNVPDSGFMVNITSKSERVKSVLQDLFVNRLSINTILPMICRATCKYGNQFMLLNIDAENGVTGWKQLPVNEIERYENGMDNPYISAYTNLNNIDIDKEDSTKFVWVGQNQYIPYRNWQIAHFRLLYDGRFLPYGVSFLNKARRHFRMLSMMEDMMLIYRLERSIERRVFKINVGAIDDADVPAYVQQIADNFKRTPIIDPLTGQLDLKKNLLNVSEDFFIPTRDDNAPNPIETLTAAQNLTAMDDIKFVQNKVLTALRLPKQFLNFEEATGDGKNLSLLDVRFSKTVNRIQQMLLMELTKIAIIHLYLLGFIDDLTNFSLSMNNPSSQAEMLELENMSKKVMTAKDATTDAGSGIPLMSMTRAWKTIMKWSDKDIKDNLEEMRLERALAAELEKTAQIIKRTGLFDSVDNIYGEPDAEYSENAMNNEEGGGMNGGGGGAAMGGMDFSEDNGDIETGNEGEIDMDTAVEQEGDTNEAPTDTNSTNLGEMFTRAMDNKINKKKKILKENLLKKKTRYEKLLLQHLNDNSLHENVEHVENIPLYNKAFLVNEDLNSISKDLEELLNK